MKFFSDRKEKALRRAHRIVKRHLRFMIDNYVLEPIGGGASTRHYFRLLLPRLARFAPPVLMVWDRRYRNSHSDFIEIQDLFRKILLPVPAIYEDLKKHGAVALQDVGNVSLYDLANELQGNEIFLEELYRKAVEHLIVLQTRADAHSKGVRAFHRAFDEKKLRWELNFTKRHFAASIANFRPRGAAAKELEGFFTDLCRRIANLPRVLCHRDYHSQNLMYYNEQLYIVDFQDARMGPCVYDLVSLLRDSYVELSETTLKRLLAYYVDRHPAFNATDHDKIASQFNLMALQRHLKHLGTFGYQATFGRRRFLQFVPLTLAYLEDNFQRFPEYSVASEILREMFQLSREAIAGEVDL